MARVTMTNDPGSDGRTLTILLEKQLDVANEASAIRKAIEGAARIFAEAWIEENRDKVIARLNVDAIANMIMIEVANDIKNEVREHKK